MPKLPSRRWWLRLALGVVWTPVAAEIFLRLLAPVPMLPRYIEAGPHGVRANMASASYRHQTPEYTVAIRTNAQGMRSDTDFAKAKSDDVRRVAIVGDSFGMGYGVDLEESSLHLLERALQERLGCEVEILNFSVSGFGPAEELVVLESEILDYDPDLVIQYFCANDPTDDTRSALFRLEDGELVRGNREYLPAVEIREFLFSFPIYRWLAGESHLYNLARDRAGSTVKTMLATLRAASSAKAPVEEASGGEISTDPTDAPGAEPIPPAGADVTPAQWLTLKILDRMRARVRNAGANFLILSIPQRGGRAIFNDRFPYSEDLPFDVVVPLEEFEAANGEMLYWERSHGHWTPLGCRLVADALLERILADGLLDPCE